MSVEFTVHDSQIEQLLPEIRAHRGRTVSIDHKQGQSVVRATVPLHDMLSFYWPGSMTMYLAGYQPTPWPMDSGDDEVGTPVHTPSGPSPKTRSSAADLE